MGSTTVIFSFSASGNMLTMGRPREARDPCGTSQTFSQYTRPRSEKHRIVSCVLAMKSWSTQSSSLVLAACLPRPPRRCARYSESGCALM